MNTNIETVECQHCHRFFTSMASYINHCFERDPINLVHNCPPAKVYQSVGKEKQT